MHGIASASSTWAHSAKPKLDPKRTALPIMGPPLVCRRLRQLCAGPSQLWRHVHVHRRLESGPEETKLQLIGRSMQLQRGLGE